MVSVAEVNVWRISRHVDDLWKAEFFTYVPSWISVERKIFEICIIIASTLSSPFIGKSWIWCEVDSSKFVSCRALKDFSFFSFYKTFNVTSLLSDQLIYFLSFSPDIMWWRSFLMDVAWLMDVFVRLKRARIRNVTKAAKNLFNYRRIIGES